MPVRALHSASTPSSASRQHAMCSGGGRGEHAVEVEQDGVVAVGGEGGAGHGKSIRVAGLAGDRARSSVDVRDPAPARGGVRPPAHAGLHGRRAAAAAARLAHDLDHARAALRRARPRRHPAAAPPPPARADRAPRAPAAVRGARARHRPPARPRAVGPRHLRARRARDRGRAAGLGARPVARDAADAARAGHRRRAAGHRLRRRLARPARRQLRARLARRHRRRLRPRRAAARGGRPHRRRGARGARPGGPVSAGAPRTAPAGSPAPRSSRSSA